MKVKQKFNKMFIVMNNLILMQTSLKENQIKYWQNILPKIIRIIIIIKSQLQPNIELRHYVIQGKMKVSIKIK